MTPRVRVAVLSGGRSSEHEISVASARSVVAALDPERYETTQIEIGRDGRWELAGSAREACLREPRASRRRRSRSSRLGAGRGARPSRRRAPHPARAVRRGRDGAGPPRARRPPVRRRGCRRLRALHGQGPLQGRAPRPRDPRGAERHAPRRRRARAPVLVSRLREARASRLVGGNQQGPRRRRARSRRSSSRAATTTRC